MRTKEGKADLYYGVSFTKNKVLGVVLAIGLLLAIFFCIIPVFKIFPI